MCKNPHLSLCNALLFCTLAAAHPVKTCSLANISNSNVFYTNGTNFGSVVSFTCNIGYDLNGTNQSSCNAEAVWTPEFPECQIADCGLPNSTDNTLYNLTSNATTYSASAVYACDDGYVQVEGSLERVCSENGMWTDSPLVCQGLFSGVEKFASYLPSLGKLITPMW